MTGPVVSHKLRSGHLPLARNVPRRSPKLQTCANWCTVPCPSISASRRVCRFHSVCQSVERMVADSSGPAAETKPTLLRSTSLVCFLSTLSSAVSISRIPAFIFLQFRSFFFLVVHRPAPRHVIKGSGAMGPEGNKNGQESFAACTWFRWRKMKSKAREKPSARHDA